MGDEQCFKKSVSSQKIKPMTSEGFAVRFISVETKGKSRIITQY